jgi:hypothetical protein
VIHAPAPIADAQRHDFSVLEAYWRDPSAIDAETAAKRATANAEWDRIAEASPWRQRQLARWAEEEGA